MTTNRIVVLLTPVFTTISVAVSHLALTRLGFHVSPDALVAVETTVAGSAAGAALKWLHGHQKYEALVHEAGGWAAAALLPTDAQELGAQPPATAAEIPPAALASVAEPPAPAA